MTSSRIIQQLVVATTLLLSSAVSAADKQDLATVRQFLSKNCLACHGKNKQEDKRRFDTLEPDFSSPATAGTWHEILDQLRSGRMPPRDRPRPDAAATRTTINWITGQLKKHGRLRTRPNDAVRRLNRREYNNTLRDLLLIDTSYSPADAFPDDDRTDGFDTVGGSLVFSPALMRESMLAAADAIDRGVKFGPRPEVRVHRILPRTATRPVFRTDEYVKIVTGTGDGFQQFRPDGKNAPSLEQGEYIIRVHATALNTSFQGVGQIDGPVRMKIRVGPPGKTAEAGSRRTIRIVDVPDNQPRTFTVRARFESGQVPIVSFENGHSGSFKNLVRKRYGPEARQNRAPIMKSSAGPQLRVFWMEVEGPLYDNWPLAGHERIFGSEIRSADPGYIRGILMKFTARAFRRPVIGEDIEPFLALYDKLRARGDSFQPAIRSTLQAVLCSPGFLYVRTNQAPLDDFGIANRLSYFLWSSMPDDRLIDLAKRGLLRRRDVRTAEATRMLTDPRSRAFVDGFTGQWLELDQLGEMPPDPKRFRHYYQGDLESAMREESRRFFAHLLDNNLDIARFLDADFTFLNQRLAEHYGITGIEGSTFRRVQLDPDMPRGGLLGQASILTLTSNGTVTSPVVRGVWVLSNLLGDTPDPPPAGVAELEPDTRGATTIREQLERHRSNKRCAVCHRHIDPLGFALEHFDPTGQWRTRYDKRQPVDTSGVLHDGRKLQGFAELKRLLLEDKNQFLSCLVKKLLVYATGNRSESIDSNQARAIVDHSRQQGTRLADLVRLVVASDQFVAPASSIQRSSQPGTSR